MERVLLLTQKASAWFNSETILWCESETLCEKVKTSLLKHTRTQVETSAIASVWGGVGEQVYLLTETRKWPKHKLREGSCMWSRFSFHVKSLEAS